jgi:hypothetical protein
MPDAGSAIGHRNGRPFDAAFASVADAIQVVAQLVIG